MTVKRLKIIYFFTNKDLYIKLKFINADINELLKASWVMF